ncbi:hypothetical protein PHISCL_06310 [Aspergillus sclerotialis]|uniref:Histidine kinase n=1 Tax=Aspergillus sclerotialis TaxID=2070753 RepID=A0A3A2ZGG1_9EURO|nr:hypothetical protein PHISCL_06310 [Aspergillus sclerotialis]
MESTSKSPHANNDSNDDHNAGRRMRELYRYFRPGSLSELKFDSNSLRGWPSGDHSDPDADEFLAVRPPSTDVSEFSCAAAAGETTTVVPDALILGDTNKTLNSFAQLAALRINVERAVIRLVLTDQFDARGDVDADSFDDSVSDRDAKFILAEATKTSDVNLPVEPSFAGNRIWNGCSVLDTAWSVCEETVAFPPSNKQTPQSSFLIVNDLSRDEQFKHLPFVSGEPHLRFYAGTPLTTDNGINLGCFFVLDTSPRGGLTDAEKETLGSLATLVIDYLKVSRHSAEGRRAAKLSHGLSYFVEGASSFTDNLHQPPPTSVPLHNPAPPWRSPRSALSVGSRNSSVDISRRSVSRSSLYSSPSIPERSPGLSAEFPDFWPAKRGPPLDESQGKSWTFRRAANLLRESLEIGGDGGVIFLEAGNSPLTDESRSGSESATDPGNPAPVLAISTSHEPFAPNPGSRSLYPAANLGSDFLSQLLRRYSKGKLWSFHRDGMVYSSDDDDTSTPNAVKREITMSKPRSKNWRSVENTTLNRYFPNTSQVLFVPLWNAANSQWFGGCFCWNTVETHVFSSAVELSSVMGFGTSIMAECSRLDTLISDQQKGDFIGSISHELRSPLHGIMAAAEFLTSTNLTDFQSSLLETMNACGRTLLDTMNQVLDYSKIVSLERRWRHNKRARELPQGKDTDSDRHLDAPVSFDLSALTEEVVEGVCLGHEYGAMSKASPERIDDTLPPGTAGQGQKDCLKTTNRPAVDVNIDIAQNDWVYNTQPGALRRIIMNVFGNSMKYTDAGCVSIHLDKAECASRIQRERNEELIMITVSDTGRGMSEEFLCGRLWTPFAQEDSLSVGTGLGLSIVRSLVKALRGSIKVHSKLGEGTSVKILLPLTRPTDVSSEASTAQPSSSPPRSGNLLPSKTNTLLPRSNCKPTHIAILNYSSSNTSVSSWKSISRYLTEWYGLELVSWQPSSHAIDILLADECDLGVLSSEDSGGILLALLIFSNQPAGREILKNEWSSRAMKVDIIRKPCGPNKLGKCLGKILSTLRRDSTIPLREISTALPDRTRIRSESLSSLTSGNNSPEPKLKLPPSPPTTDTSPTSPSISTSLNNPKPRILIVEDNTINLSLLRTYLQKLSPPTLDTATNGSEGVDAFRTSETGYDLIFMDISMPVMDGFEATRCIRSLERERKGDDGDGKAIIIALTGLSSPKDEEKALEAGVDLFLTKPVSLKEVGRIMNAWERDKCA